MEFLSSPIHNYSYETFLDDGFFKLPTEMDLEVGSDTRDAFSVNEYEDLNDGLYGPWKDVDNHPWTLSNPPSAYSSNPHLDFIGGDPQGAQMVNPHIVMPLGFQLDEEIDSEKTDSEENLATIPKTESKESSTLDDPKKFRSKLLSLKENIACVNESRAASKSGIRILKSVESELSSLMGSSQKENTSSRSKTPKNVPSLYYQEGQFYPKPAFSYSCLIAMALKNSKNGCLPVAEIYNFMCNHFPYFKTAPNGWKNSVRHNLSLNKCFEKIEKPAGSTQRKGCLWALNPSKAAKLEEEVQKCTKKDVTAIKRAMEYPEHLELLERGELKSLYDADQMEDDEEDDEIDLNDEEDVETEEPTQCEEDLIDERFSEDESDSAKTENDGEQFPALNGSGSSDFPEFKIEVDDSIYEELIGSIKSEQLFSLSDAAVKTGARISPAKKVKKYFIEVNSTSVQKNAKTDSEIFDHYDINNLLRLESETKSNQGMNKKTPPPRFNRRVCPNARIKQIKFKTWN